MTASSPFPKRQTTTDASHQVLAVTGDHRVTTGVGVRRAVDLAVRPDLVWPRLSAGRGAQGDRRQDWALIDLAGTDRDHDGHGGHHALLVRRSRTTGELAFYRTWTPRPMPLGERVRVAGRRWAIEESCQAGKGLAGLDAHPVHRCRSWRRWAVLALLAHAFLAGTAATKPADEHAGPRLTPLTSSEIQHLFAALVL